jgi:hypothetical protein
MRFRRIILAGLLPVLATTTHAGQAEFQRDTIKPFEPRGGAPVTSPRQKPSLMDPDNWNAIGEDVRRRQQGMMMPFDPSLSTDYLGARLREAAEACTRNPSQCGFRDALADTLGRLRAGRDRAQGCGRAVTAYDVFYPERRAPEPVAAAYDRECLASFVARGNPPVLPPDPVPSVFVSGGRNAAAEGALHSVGLLQIGDVSVCGALLRNDRTLVTARHCLVDEAAAAWEARTLFVRTADGRARWKVGALVNGGVESSEAVRDDWVVLRIDTSDPIGAADTALVPLVLPAEITVLGSFMDFEAVGYPSASADDKLRRALRWPRTGLCQATRISLKCLQMFCQTVTGFSGSPIFLSAADPGSAIPVVGFVSRPGSTSSTAGCGAVPGGITLAVSSSAIG